MDYRQVGASGLTVSAVGLGCNNFGGRPVHAPNGTVYGFLDLEETRSVIDAAFDAGVTLFDTSDVYAGGGSEEYLGGILADRRSEVVIATKWGSGLPDTVAWGSRRYIRQAVDASLRRLATDYIDLYQMHWPDPKVPIEETLAALDELVREGKVRYLGHSHFSGWQVADADWTARSRGFERFVSAQNYYSLLTRDAETELIPSCLRFGVGLLPYFPLENGLLTGKYRRGEVPTSGRLAGRPIPDEMFDIIEALTGLAADLGLTLLELAIAGLASMPAVSSVIAGATRASQVVANARAADRTLDEDALTQLRSVLAGTAASASAH
jgi:aryl-alcohol dehydrogenase-like predicted oxidoreductase